MFIYAKVGAQLNKIAFRHAHFLMNKPFEAYKIYFQQTVMNKNKMTICLSIDINIEMHTSLPTKKKKKTWL